MTATIQADAGRVGGLVVGGLAFLGVGLLTASFLVSPIALSSSSWQRSDAEAFAQSALKAKTLAHQKSHGQPITEKQVREAVQVHEGHRARFEVAQRQGTRWVELLRWSGVAATLASVVGYAWKRSSR